MADYDRTTDPSSAQYRTLLELVDDVFARHAALKILRERYIQLRRERGPSTYLTTELTRRDALRILRAAYLYVRGRGPSRNGAKRRISS